LASGAFGFFECVKGFTDLAWHGMSLGQVEPVPRQYPLDRSRPAADQRTALRAQPPCVLTYLPARSRLTLPPRPLTTPLRIVRIEPPPTHL
jgi:hypothetical protein